MLDDLWGILRAKQKELSTPFAAERQYKALLRGLAELAGIGQEKVVQEPKLKPASRQNLELLLQNHKVLPAFYSDNGSVFMQSFIHHSL